MSEVKPFAISVGNDSYSKLKMGNETFMVADSVEESEIATDAEVETYFNSMSDPTLTVTDRIATLTFTPVPLRIAKGMMNRRQVQFRIIRNIAHSTVKRRISRTYYGNSNYHCQNWIKQTFTKRFARDDDCIQEGGYTADITILNNEQEQLTHKITVEELTAGQIIRPISHIWNLKAWGSGNNFTHNTEYGASWGNNTGTPGDSVYRQFFIGLIWFDADYKPSKFKMSEYGILEYNTHPAD